MEVVGAKTLAVGLMGQVGLRDQLVVRADQTVSAIAATAERAKASLAATAQVPAQLGDAMATGMQHTIADMVQNWMLAHPTTAWFVTHPLVSLGLAIVLLVLLRGLLGAIGHLTEQIWLAFLRFPIVIGKGIFALSTGMFDRAPASSQPNLPTQQQRLATILDKLEALKQEQDDLLKEVRAILQSEQQSL